MARYSSALFNASRAAIRVELHPRKQRLMKKTKIIYWIFTGLMGAFMLMASVPDVLRVPQAIELFAHLGYPAYLLPFIGVAKILGVVTVLVPGFPRLKEWAYAGLVFDLTGAFYSHISVGDPASFWAFPIIALALVLGSYFFYQKMLESSRHRYNGQIG
jgi:uncharacterized membrane protein YphA (DoxX/SURF4 family)